MFIESQKGLIFLLALKKKKPTTKKATEAGSNYSIATFSWGEHCQPWALVKQMQCHPFPNINKSWGSF